MELILIGPIGAGKTTLGRLVAASAEPSASLPKFLCGPHVVVVTSRDWRRLRRPGDNKIELWEPKVWDD